jgi:hypothetical protein
MRNTSDSRGTRTSKQSSPTGYHTTLKRMGTTTRRSCSTAFTSSDTGLCTRSGKYVVPRLCEESSARSARKTSCSSRRITDGRGPCEA